MSGVKRPTVLWDRTQSPTTGRMVYVQPPNLPRLHLSRQGHYEYEAPEDQHTATTWRQQLREVHDAKTYIGASGAIQCANRRSRKFECIHVDELSRGQSCIHRGMYARARAYRDSQTDLWRGTCVCGRKTKTTREGWPSACVCHKQQRTVENGPISSRQRSPTKQNDNLSRARQRLTEALNKESQSRHVVVHQQSPRRCSRRS